MPRRGKAQIHINRKKLDALLENTVKKTVMRYRIVDGVEYGIHQEFGPRGHPSLIPAFEKVAHRDFVNYIKQALARQEDLNPFLAKAAFDIQALWANDVNVDTGAYRNSIRVMANTTEVSTTEHVED